MEGCMLNKNDIFSNGKKEFKVVGMEKRSYLLADDKGIIYKASLSKIKKGLKLVSKGSESFEKVKYPALQNRVEMESFFNPSSKMPESLEDCEKWFERLENELSPENLSCDGERSRTQIINKKREIDQVWKELQKITGKHREQPN